MIDDAALDAFQAALTAVLARRQPADALARALADDPALAAHRAWIDAFDPTLAEVAGVLAATWARRD